MVWRRALSVVLIEGRDRSGVIIVTTTEQVENVVLGGGEAGKYIAWELAQQGRPVVVIERALIGGSCPNIVCLPSKNVIRSAEVAGLMSHAASYGMRTAAATVEMEGVR